MYLVVGLGNPGKEYESTRHNTGFRVVDELARRGVIEVNRRKFSGLVGSGRVGGIRIMLVKPMTYMNRSGRCVREVMDFYKLDLANLMVIVDDLALPLGRLRIRPQGGAGGHNGLTDIINALGCEAFARLRVGIDWVNGRDAVNHVLSMFTPEEEEIIGKAVCRAADAVECWFKDGIESAMNMFNCSDPPTDR